MSRRALPRMRAAAAAARSVAVVARRTEATARRWRAPAREEERPARVTMGTGAQAPGKRLRAVATGNGSGPARSPRRGLPGVGRQNVSNVSALVHLLHKASTAL
jgi:hypothetical protein